MKLEMIPKKNDQFAKIKKVLFCIEDLNEAIDEMEAIGVKYSDLMDLINNNPDSFSIPNSPNHEELTPGRAV